MRQEVELRNFLVLSYCQKIICSALDLLDQYKLSIFILIWVVHSLVFTVSVMQTSFLLSTNFLHFSNLQIGTKVDM